MSKGLGLADEAAAQMAISVAGLTGDVASFYNVSQEVADTALKSIWTGETESLKQFGVVMTQANLQQYAYQQGIKKTISEMTQAEQVQLRYMYVTDQLSLAQGDFVKTSGSWANQTRILSERWKQFMTIIGTAIFPTSSMAAPRGFEIIRMITICRISASAVRKNRSTLSISPALYFL